MSSALLLRCYNKGCGKEYKEQENGEGKFFRFIKKISNAKIHVNMLEFVNTVVTVTNIR